MWGLLFKTSSLKDPRFFLCSLHNFLSNLNVCKTFQVKRKLTKLNPRRTDVGTAQESWVLYHIMRFSSSPNEKLLVWPTISEICQRKAAPTQGQCTLLVFLILTLVSFLQFFFPKNYIRLNVNYKWKVHFPHIIVLNVESSEDY